MNKIAERVLLDHLSKNKKINLKPSIKKVKFDVGTSGDGPNTNIWLKENDLCVIGIEPNPVNLKNMYLRYKKQIHEDKLILLQTALSFGEPKVSEFYCVKHNEGCSSLHEPIFDRIPEYKELSSVLFTPVIRMTDIFDAFPWNQISFIDHLKIPTESNNQRTNKQSY